MLIFYKDFTPPEFIKTNSIFHHKSTFLYASILTFPHRQTDNRIPITDNRPPEMQTIRVSFFNLLNEYARKQNYEVIAEITCMGTKGKAVRPDGIVKNLFGLDIGLWESKDDKTDIYAEIDAKIRKGYPLTNILFEDSKTAELYQRGNEAFKADMRDAENHSGKSQHLPFCRL